MYRIEPMSSWYAYEISSWTYPAEYSVYSFQKNCDTVNELMNGEYFACVDAGMNLIGYFCFGESAQISTMENNVVRQNFG